VSAQSKELASVGGPEVVRSEPPESAKKCTENVLESGRKYRWQQCASILLVVTAIPAMAADPDTSLPKSPASEQEGYLHHVFAGPGPLLRSAAGAGISQSKGTPHEWGGGIKGYARRLGSAFGKHIVKS